MEKMNRDSNRVKVFWNRSMNWLTKITEVAVIILVICLTGLVAASVFFRYVIGHSIFFGSELSRYILVWVVFLSSSLAIRRGAHVGVDFFRQIVSPKIRRAMVHISIFLVAVFSLVILIFSSVYLIPPLWTQVTAAMGIRLFWIFLCLPIGALLMLLQSIDYLIQYRDTKF